MTQFTLYSHSAGPNGWKVVFALKALGVTYETKYLNFATSEQKAEPFISLNPNGRIPCLVDNATGFTLWESGAILLYLTDKYDKDHKISFPEVEDKYKLLQYLFFQVSGQGPYFGQAYHFILREPQKIPGAITRYQTEVARVFEVLDGVLRKQEWNAYAIALLTPPGTDVKTQFPAFHAWHEKLLALDYVKATYAEKETL